jgi:hypothetical protein
MNAWTLDWEAAITTPYRTFDDGIAGWTDRDGRYRLSWAFWDPTQPHVTERFAGDTNPEGLAGETITDDRVFGAAGPTSGYARMTVCYPQPDEPFRIELEGARPDDDALAFRATVTNESDTARTLHVLFKGAAAPGQAVTAGEGSLGIPGGDGTQLVVGSTDLAAFQASDDQGALDRNLRAGGLDGSELGRIGVLGTELTLGPGETQDIVVWAYEHPEAARGFPVIERDRMAAAIDARRAETEPLFRDATTAHTELYRDALMDLLWARSLYRWDGETPLDPRLAGTIDADDVLVMPDKWEYPWFASWDAAFHAVTAALIDPELGAAELRFLLSPGWQTPEGHVPCGEWVMINECPPLFAWAALRVADAGAGDALLAELYPALQAQYGFWWDRLQVQDSRLFRGGFMGMDNLPGRTIHAQADASGWMAMFARDLAEIATRLGLEEDAAAYLAQREEIAAAVNERLWDETDGFYFDTTDRAGTLLHVPSYSGLVPLIAGIVPPDRAERLLAQVRDPDAFLGPAGIRSLSAAHDLYQPGLAGKGVNSNWRGPVWVPLNLLLIDAIAPLDPALAADVRDRVVGTVEREWQATDRFWEFHDGDTGAGLGADAQTGWTAAVAVLIAEGWPADAPPAR